MTRSLTLATVSTCLLLSCASLALAEYEPYRYQRTYHNRVVLVGNGGGGCGCGAGGSGSRIEYAPSRYQRSDRHNLATPPGIAGGVAVGAIPEYRFDDLQPRYPQTQPSPTGSGFGSTYNSLHFGTGSGHWPR